MLRGLRKLTIIRPFSSGISADSHGIIPQLSSVRHLAHFKISLPQLVVVGNQSSGKSTLLDNLLGEDFLPKGDTMVTRRPIEVSLVRDTSSWGRVDGSRILNVSEMKRYIAQENKDVDFSEVPLRIEYHSPGVIDLNLVDLPGYITTVREDQDSDLPKKIKSLCGKYLENPKNLILCVVAASSDIATSVAVSQARKYDEDHSRTLGILTKIDLCQNNTIRQILSNQSYRLPLGYIGVRGRTSDEIQQEMSFDRLIKVEEKMIHDRKLTGLPVGLPYLRQKLSDMLLFRVMQFFPEIVESINKCIEQKSKNGDLLTQLYKHRDLEQIAKRLETLVNHFHVNSPSRLQLEVQCRQEIHNMFSEIFENISNDFVYENGKFNPSKVINLELEKISEGDGKKDPKNRSKNYPYNRYSNRDSDRVSFYTDETPLTTWTNQTIMGDLMIYGPNTPKYLGHEKLRELSNNLLRIAVVSRHFYPYIPEDFQIDKSKWHKQLEHHLAEMIENGIAEKTRQKIISTLIGFVGQVSDDKHDKDQELAHFFFEYLIEQINSRTDYQQVAPSIDFMINREKRPQVDYNILLKQVWDYLHANNITLFKEGWLSYQFHDYRFPIYEKLWTVGYLNALRDRISDDVYRVYAVNVIHSLVYEIIHNSLKLFKSGKIFTEAKRQLAEQRKLEGVRDALQNFNVQNPDFNPTVMTTTYTEEIYDPDDQCRAVEVMKTVTPRQKTRKSSPKNKN